MLFVHSSRYKSIIPSAKPVRSKYSREDSMHIQNGGDRVLIRSKNHSSLWFPRKSSIRNSESITKASSGQIQRLNGKKLQRQATTGRRLCSNRRDHWLPARVFPRSMSRRQVATPTDYLKEFRRGSSLRFVEQRRRCPLNVCLFSSSTPFM